MAIIQGTHYIRYDGELPSTLFRYRSISSQTIDRLLNFEILGSGVYLSSLKQLNDPDEGRLLVRFPRDPKAVERFWFKALNTTSPAATRLARRKEARELTQRVVNADYFPSSHVDAYTRLVVEHTLRVACFTTSGTNYAMWANYAKHFSDDGQITDHAGICIRYACDESWRTLGIHPIEYTDTVPVIDPTEDDVSKFAKVMHKKSTEWRGESEWRMSAVLHALPPFPPNLDHNCKVRGADFVTGVIFGLKTPEEFKVKFSEAILGSTKGIALLQLCRSESTFERTLVPYVT